MSRVSFCTRCALARRARTLFRIFIFVAALSTPVFALELTGTVSNAATRQNLEGARVVLQGTSREVFTDNQGVYRLPDVAPGNVVLSVSYTGLTTVEVPATVTAGGRNQQDVGLTADIYRLSKFVVSGDREGNAQAITLQRLSDGVKSIVSADAFGGLAGNPAELVARLPGIEGESAGGDIRYIRVRGLHQNLSSITMDGNRVADAASAGVTREFQFQTIGSDTIERIEVVKLPTPDMDGDSIGGNVNMISKSAFDSTPERRIRGSIGTIWRATDDRDRIRPNFSVSYSEVFGGRLGVSMNAAYRPHYSLQEQTRQTHQSLPAGVTGPAYTHTFGFVDFRNLRKRSGVGLKLDYKWSGTTRFYVNASYNKHVEHESDTEADFTTNQGIATRDAAGNLTGNNGIIPGFTDTVTEVRPVNNSVVTLNSTNLYKDGRTQNLSLGGVHRYEHLDITYDAFQSNSKANYAGTSEPAFIARGMGWRIDRSENGYLPTITQTAGPDWTQISSYTENSYNINRRAGWDDYRGASLNVKKDFETPVPTYIKTGVRLREQTRRNVNTPFSGTYVGPDGVMGLNPATGRNDDNLAQFMTARPLPGDLARYPRLPFPNVVGEGPSFWTALQQNPEYLRQNLAANLQAELQGNTSFKENITGYYIMGNMALGKLSVLGGVRVETTKVEAEGAMQALTPEERALRAAFMGPLTDAEIRRRVTAEFGGRQTREGESRDVLPGIHFKFSPIPNLVTRLGYAANIGRPGIGQLIPTTTVNFENRTVNTSNPALQSQVADNFDFSAEYYFEPAGVVSAGVFLKEIKRFIYTAGGQIIPTGQDNGFDGEFAGYTLTSQANGGFAKVKGLELNYNQQFTFLPGFWSGFGAFANFTKMEAEGNYGSGTAIALAPTPKIAGFNPLNANAGISYIRNKVTVRVQLNHRARYLLTFNANESRLVYARARTTVGVKTSYRLSRRFDAYFDVVNLFSEPDREREFTGGRPQLYTMLVPQLFFGINGRL
ncbi:MAG: TonB-dependent receptor [Opitutaceae bacterium]|nr:TonB-dependent receptor [Opitutaceae bacterium]